MADHACRALNIGVALGLLMAVAPLMALVAIAIRLTSRGPTIYRQQRVGLDRRDSGNRPFHDRRRRNRGGRTFQIYKFRTMYQSRSGRPQVWAQDGDSRVTPVGRLLRAYRLDELPQLVNVLKGDMNIVGPRPEQLLIFEELSEELESYAGRQRVLPGITGLAQVNQGYDCTLEDVKSKLEFDLEYIQRRSPLRDLRIMAKTAPVMIFKQGSR